MKPNLILMSHGNMAKEVLASAEMIIGEIENAKYITMQAMQSVEEIKTNLQSIISNPNEQFLIMVDLVGGTPCNVAMIKLYENENIKVISGMNLSMVIEFATSAETEFEKLIVDTINAGKMAITELKKEETPEDEDEDGYED